MFSEDEIPEYFLSEPGHYVAAHGMMIGSTENIEEGDDSINCVSLIFIDTDGDLHPVLLHPEGELLKYLLSDEFREVVGKIKQKLVDKDAR
jgi:hypothetical protein